MKQILNRLHKRNNSFQIIISSKIKSTHGTLSSEVRGSREGWEVGRVGEDWGEQRGRGAEEGSLIPDAEERVPGAGSDGHAVLRHAETRHAVVVAGKDTCDKNILLMTIIRQILIQISISYYSCMSIIKHKVKYSFKSKINVA